MWVLNKEKTIAMSCLPKAGSQSIRGSMVCQKIYQNSEVLKIPVRVAWFRNPLERLKSAGSFFHYLNLRDGNGQQRPTIEQTATWETFIDYALEIPNPHWNSQLDLLTLDEYVPTITHRFEDIKEKWVDYIPGLLPWNNACSRMPMDDYRENDINEFLKKDTEFWLSL